MKGIITVGLPASGKSTWAARVAPEATLERDMIRKRIVPDFGWDSWSPQMEGEVSALWEEEARALAASAHPVVVFADTHLTLTALEKSKAVLEGSGRTVRIVLFDVPPDVCAARNARRGRAGRVDASAWERLIPRFELMKTALEGEAVFFKPRICRGCPDFFRAKGPTGYGFCGNHAVAPTPLDRARVRHELMPCQNTPGIEILG